MAYVQTVDIRPKQEGSIKSRKKDVLADLRYKKKAASDRHLLELSDFYQKKINKLFKK
jgi:hypothetical protein